MTKVSVLVPVYNGIRNYPKGMMLRNLLSTLQNQGEVEIEMCIVDDASEDDTFRRMLGLHLLFDGQVKTLKNSSNRGIAYSLNVAAEVATGDYMIVQSVRSWYEPNCFIKMVKAIEEEPALGFSYGITHYTGAYEARHVPPAFNRESFKRGFHSLFGYMYKSSAITQHGCRYSSYLYKEGKYIDISDYDFIMQLIFELGWEGRDLRSTNTLHYYYQEKGQMTELVHRYQSEIDDIFNRKWKDA
jgi:glycosyltransferase involved in cell wall biosynthesis